MEVTEKLVTTKELATVLGVDVSTVIKTVKRLNETSDVLPKFKQGQTPKYTEEQATLIKQEIQKHHNLASRQIDSVSTEAEILANFTKAAFDMKQLYESKIAQIQLERDSYKNCLEDMTSAKGYYSLKSVAKILNYKPHEFNRQLIAIGFCLNNSEHEIKQEMKDRGYGTFIIPKTTSPDGRLHGSTKISAKGIVWIAKKLKVEPNNELLETLVENN